MREYKGWQIMTVGGFCTMKRYEASKDEKWHWAFKLKDCKVLCDTRDEGLTINELYLKPLYI